MRINLQCPYSEKDAAKSLGARWDAEKKTWYVVDPQDLAPFARWMGHLLKVAAPSEKKDGREKKRPKFSVHEPFTTTGAGFCEIAHPAGLLPWEEDDPHELISLVRAICA